MRKRSQTIQADSYEEFLELSIAQSPDMDSHSPFVAQSPYFSPIMDNQKSLQDYCEDYDDCFEDVMIQIPLTDPFNDLNTQIDSYDGTRTPSTDHTGYTSRTLSASSTSECDGWSPFFNPYVKAARTKIFQVMTIGQSGAGKHGLVNTVFGEETSKGLKVKSPFDLLIKHQEQEGCNNTYKFWLRDPTDTKTEPLVKVYYKSINLYIFLYKINDIQSFECLDKAIQQVKDEVGSEKFRGVLLANISGETHFERQVSYEDGLKLKQKHKLSQFVEIKYSSNALEKVVLDFINSKDKLKI